MGITITGGQAFKEHLKKLAQKSQIKVGIMESATNGDSESVAEYAAMNEFGTKAIPSRPFMRQTFAQKNQDWVNGVKDLLANGSTPDDALALIGKRMVDNIQATIKSNMPPKNSEEWAEFKNKNEKATFGLTGWETLIYTGALFHSVQWQFGDDESA